MKAQIKYDNNLSPVEVDVPTFPSECIVEFNTGLWSMNTWYKQYTFFSETHVRNFITKVTDRGIKISQIKTKN